MKSWIMNSFAVPYILILLLVLALGLFFLYWSNRKRLTGPEKRRAGLSVLAVLSLYAIIAGIVFREDQPLGYILIGTGVVLAVIDIYLRISAHRDD